MLPLIVEVDDEAIIVMYVFGSMDLAFSKSKKPLSVSKLSGILKSVETRGAGAADGDVLVDNDVGTAQKDEDVIVDVEVAAGVTVLDVRAELQEAVI